MIIELPSNLVNYSPGISVFEGGMPPPQRAAHLKPEVKEWCDENLVHPVTISTRTFETIEKNPEMRLYGHCVLAMFGSNLDGIHFKMRWM